MFTESRYIPIHGHPQMTSPSTSSSYPEYNLIILPVLIQAGKSQVRLNVPYNEHWVSCQVHIAFFDRDLLKRTLSCIQTHEEPVQSCFNTSSGDRRIHISISREHNHYTTHSTHRIRGDLFPYKPLVWIWVHVLFVYFLFNIFFGISINYGSIRNIGSLLGPVFTE